MKIKFTFPQQQLAFVKSIGFYPAKIGSCPEKISFYPKKLVSTPEEIGFHEIATSFYENKIDFYSTEIDCFPAKRNQLLPSRKDRLIIQAPQTLSYLSQSL